MPGFSLDEFSDRELMLVVHDLTEKIEPESWTTAWEVAQKVNLGEEGKLHVGIRFAWMRRYGVLEKDPGHPARWRLSAAGREMVAVAKHLSQAQREITKLSNGELVWVSHTLAGRFHRAPDAFANVTRREWQREIKRRGRS